MHDHTIPAPTTPSGPYVVAMGSAHDPMTPRVAVVTPGDTLGLWVPCKTSIFPGHNALGAIQFGAHTAKLWLKSGCWHSRGGQIRNQLSPEWEFDLGLQGLGLHGCTVGASKKKAPTC
jgi:hypothetical protein